MIGNDSWTPVGLSTGFNGVQEFAGLDDGAGWEVFFAAGQH
ncbi:MAG: hypothetical protein ABJN26_05660 [Stappiaceae bacterium]